MGPEARSSRGNPPSIEALLNDLDHLVQGAIAFYRDFQETFCQDIVRIQSYAPDDLISMILKAKMSATAGFRSDPRRGSVSSPEVRHSASSVPSFYDTSRDLLGGMKKAAKTLSYCNASHGVDPSLVARQIKKSYLAVAPVFQSGSISVPDLNSLATELEMLSVFLSRNGAGCRRTEQSYDEVREPMEYHDGDVRDGDQGGESEQWGDG